MIQDPRDTPDEPVKPDLKHDSMEFSAATEGDDVLDSDTESELDLEDENISAEELDYLEGDEEDDIAAALDSAEVDSQADADVTTTLPATGSPNLLPFWMLGLGLLLFGATVLLNEKRRLQV